MGTGSGWDDDTPRAKPRARLVVGALLLVAGAAFAVLAATGALGGDDPRPTKVGKLIDSDLPAPPTTAPGAPVATDPAGGTTSPAPAPTGEPSWPAAVQGRPAAFGTDGDAPPAQAGDLAEGIYVWSDFKGWHVWFVGGKTSDATVTVSGNGDLTPTPAGDGADLEADGADRFTVGRGTADQQVVGADFNAGFYVSEITITVAGDLPLRTGAGAAPASSPLTLRYQPQG